MPPLTGNDGTPSGFFPNAPFGVWGDSGSAGPFGPGGNGVIGSSALSSGIAGFTFVDSDRASGVYGAGPQVGVAGGVTGSDTAPTGKAGVYGTGSNGRNLGGTGVHGESDTGSGVFGQSLAGVAISGSAGQSGKAASLVKAQSEPGTQAAVEVLNGANRGEGLWVAQSDPSNPHATIKLVLLTSGTNNFLECHQPDGVRRAHITHGGTFVSGSDFAEALPARNGRNNYEPGDVLVMARDGTQVEKTSEPYSRRLVGVHSTRPGVLGADKGGEIRVDPEEVPIAVLGIVPTKVIGENGPLEVGDFLVTSPTPGYAMKGTDPERLPGATLGKALEPMSEDVGVVRVLVSLR